VAFFLVIHLAVVPVTFGDSAFQNLLVSVRRQGTMQAAVSRAQRRNPKWHRDINVVG
jgi:hypothetical protein